MRFVGRHCDVDNHTWWFWPGDLYTRALLSTGIAKERYSDRRPRAPKSTGVAMEVAVARYACAKQAEEKREQKEYHNHK